MRASSSTRCSPVSVRGSGGGSEAHFQTDLSYKEEPNASNLPTLKDNREHLTTESFKEAVEKENQSRFRTELKANCFTRKLFSVTCLRTFLKTIGFATHYLSKKFC